jgi:hypothetical protein
MNRRSSYRSPADTAGEYEEPLQESRRIHKESFQDSSRPPADEHKEQLHPHLMWVYMEQQYPHLMWVSIDGTDVRSDKEAGRKATCS